MRDGCVGLGRDADKDQPAEPLLIWLLTNSVMIDEFWQPRAFQMDVDANNERNIETLIPS